MNALAWIIARLKEPSTAAAASCIGIAFGLPPGTIDIAVQAAIVVTGLAGVVLAEKKK